MINDERPLGLDEAMAAQSTAIPRALGFVGALITTLSVKTVTLVLGLMQRATTWLFDSRKSKYGLAVTRALMGASALGLLMSNWTTRLYSFGAGSAWNGEMAEPASVFAGMWLFSLFHAVMGNSVLYTLCYIGLGLLAVLIIVGWRYRIVAPIFWVGWVSFIEANDMLGDQGDNMFRIAFLLLMFTDASGRLSLDARRRKLKHGFALDSIPNQLGTVVHNLAILALAAQVIFVYTSGALFKSAGAPWREGWAVYDPLATARFGTWPVLTEALTAWGPMVAMFTLGSVFIQALFGVMLLNRATRVIALFSILSFHIGIGVLMGLPWFSLTMVAIDAIFVRDITWRRMIDGTRRIWLAS